MKPASNILMIQEVAKGLGELRDEVIFVGGITTSFYIDDKAAPSPTPTDDVDFIVEISTKSEYDKFEKKLRAKGFKDPVLDPDENHPICRKIYKDIQVDVMPIDEKVLGFSNSWYEDGLKTKKAFTLPDKTNVYIFNSTYFLATKLEAFNHRGKRSDIRTSQDLEDILSVLDGCSFIETELKSSDKKVRKFIGEEFKDLLKDDQLLEEAAHGFMNASGDPVKRARTIVNRVRKIVESLDS